MTIVHTLGFPRIGAKRELKQALEQYWRGEIDTATLEAHARALRLRHWQLQHEAGARHLPCGDFSLYDHVLDTALRFGAVPESHTALLAEHRLHGLFALARGHQDARHDLRALEMTKWFDTNYHYLVPELRAGQSFRLEPDDLLGVFHEARAAGFQARPVVLGPVSFLKLAKTIDGSPALELLDALLPHYAALFSALHEAGAEWLQLDEPWLATDLDHALHRRPRRRPMTTPSADRPRSARRPETPVLHLDRVWRVHGAGHTAVEALRSLVEAHGKRDVVECHVAPGVGADAAILATADELGARVTTVGAAGPSCAAMPARASRGSSVSPWSPATAGNMCNNDSRTGLRSHTSPSPALPRCSLRHPTGGRWLNSGRDRGSMRAATS